MSLNDFDEKLFPAWNANDPERFLGQLHVIKDLGLIHCDNDLIYGNFTQSLSDIAESKQMADSEQGRPTQDELHPSVQSSSNCRRSPSRHRRKQTRSKSKRRSRFHRK